MRFNTMDIVLFSLYCLIIIGVGLWVSREKKGHKRNSKDYFLASKSLPWWAVGASLIAANISAEQFIGMSGSGFAIGLGIASYEWMAALTLIIVAVFFLPIYLKKGIYTMPEFLEKRFDTRVKTTMAIFWLVVFVFVNLTSILYLGALAVRNMMGVDMMWGIVGLAAFAAIYSVYGGLKAVAWTDVVQVIFLVAGGLVTTYVALDMLGYGSFTQGLSDFFVKGSAKLDLILEPGDHIISNGQGGTKDAYMDLPGISVIIGGMWVANLYYWGCNQYIIQRALASKSLAEAQKGLVFAGFLKLLLPLIVVVPGIVAYILASEGRLDGINVADDAYPVLLSLIPNGIRGLAFAALVAAIVSSLASMMNSISTIFTMDIYKPYIRPKTSDTGLVTVGRTTSVVALAVACLVAPMLSDLDQAFQFIQEFTGFVSPGALAIFGAGFFYKKATANGALAAAIGTFVFSGLLWLLAPEVPFMDRMGIVFLLCAAVIWLFAVLQPRSEEGKAITITRDLFRTTTQFKVWSIIIIVILIVLYSIWW